MQRVDYAGKRDRALAGRSPEELVTEGVDDARIYRLRSSLPGETNSHGFADLERSRARPPGVYRIAVVGDSVTQQRGWNRTDTYVHQLEEGLRKRRPQLEVEVLNFGVTGYSTEQELASWRREVVDFEPDLLLLQYHHNDAQDPVLDGGNGGLGLYYATPRWYTGRFFARRWLHLRRRAWIDRHGLDELGFDLATQKYGWEKNTEWLEEMATTAAQRGVEARAFVVPSVPVGEDWSVFDGATGRVHAELVERLRIVGFETLDPVPRLREMPIDAYRGAPDDPWHPSPEGYRVLSGLLADWLAPAL